MFRGIVNSLNGGRRHNGAPHEHEANNNNQGEQEASSDGVDTNGKQPVSKIGRKSRKRLTAMMGKLSSSIHSNGKTDSKTTNDHIPTYGLKEISLEDRISMNEDEDDNDEIGLSDEDKKKSKSDYILAEELCDLPTFLHTKNCDPHLIEETRRLLKERFAKNPDAFYDNDYNRMMTDDWTVSRFLLRRRLDPKRTAKLMEECGRFRKQYKMSEVQLWEFPIEFHKAGGLFKYAPDRVGNLTVYMRVKMYRRVPEISDVFKAFILCVLEECDRANGGRGTAVIFDLSGCGLQNVDLSFLSWLLSSFRNYCPKGVSYILVYNLPWILNATCKLAMTWMSANNRRALRFVYGDEIENFIARENLPDYLGGTCKINYRAVPAGALPATEVCSKMDLTKKQALKIKELFKEYLDESDDEQADVDQDDFKSLPDDPENFDSSEASKNPADIVAQASKFIA